MVLGYVTTIVIKLSYFIKIVHPISIPALFLGSTLIWCLIVNSLFNLFLQGESNEQTKQLGD